MHEVVDLEPKLRKLQQAIETVVRGKSEPVKLALVSLLAEGHLLIEDVPGGGKTTLAHALARGFDVGSAMTRHSTPVMASLA